MPFGGLISTNSVICFTSFLFFSTIGMKMSNYFNKMSATFSALPVSTKHDWESRNNSTLHAVLVSLLCVIVLITDTDLSEDPIWGKSWRAEAISSITVGYLVSDMLYLVQASQTTTDAYITTWAHHLLAAGMYMTTIIYGCFAYIAICRLLAELSTPFVNARWKLDVCDMKHTRSYLMNGWLMMSVFFICRIAVMPYCYYLVYLLKDSEGIKRLPLPLPLCVIPVAIVDGLNLYWFGKMVGGLRKYLRANRTKELMSGKRN